MLSLVGGTAFAANSLPTETHHIVPTSLAVEAAQAAIASCKAQGWNVSVTVADRSGNARLVLMGDGANLLTKEVTRRKAYTAALLGIPTGDFAKRIATPGAFNPMVYDPQMAAGPGGLPIKAGTETIGGIAAAGAPGGDKDEACAAAGLAKISDRLN
ncbi:MAG TPA: heme-binding protein [Stellaceae bacterium]